MQIDDLVLDACPGKYCFAFGEELFEAHQVFRRAHAPIDLGLGVVADDVVARAARDDSCAKRRSSGAKIGEPFCKEDLMA